MGDEDNRVGAAEELAHEVAPDLDAILVTIYPDADTLDTIRKVFAIAKGEKIPTYLAADRLAEQRIQAVGSMVRTWPQWPNK